MAVQFGSSDEIHTVTPSSTYEEPTTLTGYSSGPGPGRDSDRSYSYRDESGYEAFSSIKCCTDRSTLRPRPLGIRTPKCTVGQQCCPLPPPPIPPIPRNWIPCFDCCDRIRPQKPWNNKCCRNPCDNYMSQCRKPCAHPYHPPIPCELPHDACCCIDKCGAVRRLKVCKTELQRLRLEKWKQEEREAIMEERRNQEWMEQQYKTQANEWDRANADCARDRQTRQRLLRQIMCQRREMQQLRAEARAWRRFKYRMMEEQQREAEDQWAKDFCQREDERRVHQEQLKIEQEDKWLEAQTTDRDSQGMAMPELEEMRRMFAPVNRGPNETFEYFLLEPRPTAAEQMKSAQMKMAALMGLRNQHGMHFNCSDKAKKKTTVTVAMGPQCLNGECTTFNTQPGASCCSPNYDFCQACSETPNVPVPECLQSLMKTLSYRVDDDFNSPLLRMKSFGPGPHFNGARLYGTIVVPKGQHIAPLYTDRSCITY